VEMIDLILKGQTVEDKEHFLNLQSFKVNEL